MAHRLLEQYAETPTWVLGVDGDELYDPSALARLRIDLVRGDHDAAFRLKAHVLNCDLLDHAASTASGWLARPLPARSRSCSTSAAVESWTEAPIRCRAVMSSSSPGYSWETRKDLAGEYALEKDPLRLLHVCFLRRSSRERVDVPARANLDESREYEPKCRRGDKAHAEAS